MTELVNRVKPNIVLTRHDVAVCSTLQPLVQHLQEREREREREESAVRGSKEEGNEALRHEAEKEEEAVEEGGGLSQIRFLHVCSHNRCSFCRHAPCSMTAGSFQNWQTLGYKFNAQCNIYTSFPSICLLVFQTMFLFGRLSN
ncbi:uncharacterized protein LOC122078062 [Macadamia integrifolia]|uniref:uncharacterized protein LOC122078062 n=1 Tax=Macadamia integrifolia TaxID=60698 RepID=UPI001C4FD584|nr:uncharacterized protein LOC122078062 [Macadamia integrifolia]